MDSLSNAYPGYLFSFSQDGIIVAANDYFLKDLGYSLSEIKDKLRIDALLTAGGRIFFQTHFHPLVKMQKTVEEIYLTFLTANQEPLPVLFNMALQGSADQYVVHCSGMKISKRNSYEKELLNAKNLAEKALEENLELITVREELNTTQRQLEHRLRMLSQKSTQQVELNKVLSHDLQEPLRKIKLFAGILSQHEEGLSQKALATIAKIDSFVVKVSLLLEKLERYNSLNNKKKQYTEIQLSEVFEVLKSRFNNQQPPVHFVLRDFLTSRQSDFSFPCDRNLLLNLLTELIEYAIRYKNTGSHPLEIKIAADIIRTNLFIETKNRYRYEDCIRLVLSDNGKVFLESSNPFHLFDRPQRSDLIDIGLAYSQKIVQLLNGEITLTSSADEGTVFSILIPLEG